MNIEVELDHDTVLRAVGEWCDEKFVKHGWGRVSTESIALRVQDGEGILKMSPKVFRVVITYE